MGATGLSIKISESPWQDGVLLEINDGKGGEARINVDIRSFLKFRTALMLFNFDSEKVNV